jgi:hypothetical protein
MKLRNVGILAAAVAGALMGASGVHANSIEILVGSPVVTPLPSGGGFDWAYSISLTATDGITAAHAADAGRLIGGSSGSVFSFYDLGGLVNPAVADRPAGYTVGSFGFFTGGAWTASNQAVTGSIASEGGIYTPLVDNGNLNEVFVYTGANFTAPAGPNTTLGVAHIYSTLGPASASTTNFGARWIDSDTVTSNVNSQVPLGPRAIPVPAAAWAGLSTLSGLGLLGVMKKRRR